MARPVLGSLLGVLLVLAACATPPEQEAPDIAGEEGSRSPGSDAAEEEEGGPEVAPDDAPADDEATPERAAGVTVVATVAPLADLVAQVLGDRGAVTSLVPPGADSHTYEPRPADVAELEDADAYIGNGLHLNDGALELAASTLPDDAPLVRLGEEAVAEDRLVFDHDHDHSHDHHDHSHEDGEGGGPNPHTWMNVPFAMDKVDRIAEVLSEVDPDGADTYRANAESYQRQLRALHESIAEAAATVPEDDRTLVTFHDAYSYFAEEYGFEIVGALQPSDYSEPSAGDVATIIDQVRAEDVPAVFGSAVLPDDVTEAIAEETGATYHGDLADDVLPGEPGDPEHSYLGLMARNARAVVGGLGGDADRIVAP